MSRPIPERVYLSTDRQWAKSQTPICTEEYVRADRERTDAMAWRGAPIGGPVEHALRQHAHLYRHSASFKMAVDTLIPLLIDALAMKAERDWAKHEALVKKIMESTGRPLVPDEFLEALDREFNPATGQPR